jgi:DNA-binding transcriptional LysR family regulator
MNLTGAGKRLLTKAESTLDAHRAFIEEATRIRGNPSGKFTLGSGCESRGIIVGHVLKSLTYRCPDVEVTLEHGTSQDILDGIRNGSLDAGFYNNCGDADADLAKIEISGSDIYLAAPPGTVSMQQTVDWQAVSKLTWNCPTARNCCKIAAEELFEEHNIRPRRIITVDRERMIHKLIIDGVGVGLLHGETIQESLPDRGVDVVCKIKSIVREYFGHLPGRARDPLVDLVATMVREAPALANLQTRIYRQAG